MPEASWLLFVAASLVLIATPGPDMNWLFERQTTHRRTALENSSCESSLPLPC